MPFTLFANSERARGMVRLVVLISRWLAGTLVGVGIAALVGATTGPAWLAAPSVAWRPMHPASAIAAIALGIALWGRIHARRPFAVGGSAVALTVSLPAIFDAAFASHLFDMPVASAVMIATAATGLLGGLLRGRPQVEKLVLALAGIGLVAESGTILLVNAVGASGLDRGFATPVSSVQVVVSMGLLGLCFIALVWWSSVGDFEPPSWLPPATAIIGVLTVVVLWQMLTVRGRQQRTEMTRVAALTEQRLLMSRLSESASVLRRAAGWASTGITIEQQVRDMRALQRDVQGLVAIHRIGTDGRSAAHLPFDADTASVTAAWNDLPRAARTRSDTVLFVPHDAAHDYFLVVAPTCDLRCDGAIVGVLRASLIFHLTMRDTMGAFRFSIAGPRGPLPESHTLPDLPVEADRDRPFGFSSMRWTLSTWPVAGGLASDGDLPGAVLLLGLVVTGLVPLTLQLARNAWLEARARERSQLSFAVDSATDGLWEVHLPTGHATRSPALWRHLRFDGERPPESVAGWNALIHPEDRRAVDRALARHLAGEADTYEAEYRVQASDGIWHTLVERGRVVDRTPLGAPNRILGITADVTESRAASEARSESARRFRALFNSGFQFQVLLDRESRVLEVNQVALAHLGTTIESVRERDCWDTLWWANDVEARENLREACGAATLGESRSWIQELTQPHGKPNLVLEVSIKPIADGGDPHGQFLLEARDVTERRRAEEALKTVDLMATMGRIVARVAHEINNPLAGIRNAFLLIKDAVPADHPHHAYVGSIEREVERISSVTRLLYETYRPERESLNDASLHQEIGDSVALLEQVNRGRNVTVLLDIHHAPISVPIPSGILRQVTINLVQNAIDASPPGGVVSVEATVTASGLRIRVCDQGPGVADELRESIFAPFFSTKERVHRTSGMGLGLTLLRQAVSAAGGSISLDTPLGGGAAFTVVLPLGGERNGDHA